MIKNSTNKIQKIVEIDISSKKDFIIMPETIENNTRPFRYSFFKGLKNVLKRSESEKSAATYLLNNTKNSIREPKTSLYQKAIRYKG